jgi:hypothetical protein
MPQVELEVEVVHARCPATDADALGVEAGRIIRAGATDRPEDVLDDEVVTIADDSLIGVVVVERTVSLWVAMSKRQITPLTPARVLLAASAAIATAASVASDASRAGRWISNNSACIARLMLRAADFARQSGLYRM